MPKDNELNSGSQRIFSKSEDDPLFLFEHIAKRLCLNKWYYFPLPLIAIYLATSAIPHLLLSYVNSPWSIYYGKLGTTIGWLILVIVVSYGTVMFKRRYISGLKKMIQYRVIRSDSKKNETMEQLYIKQINYLTNKKLFVIFLAIFEILVAFFWYANIGEKLQVVADLSAVIPQIPGTVIMILVLPVAAQVFTAALQGAILPLRLKNYIHVDPVNFDHHGGLKPFGDILLIIEYVYVGGVVISFLAFEQFRDTPLLWGLFIGIMSALIFAPQRTLRNKLSVAKRRWLGEIEGIYKNISPISADESDFVSPNTKYIDHGPYDSRFLTSLKMIKDEVEMMKTLSFDIISLWKLATVLVSLRFLSSYLDPVVRQIGIR